MFAALYCSTAIRRTIMVIAVGASLSMLTACDNNSGDDDDTAGIDMSGSGGEPPVVETPVMEPADFTGTWMLTEVSEESFGAWNNNVLLDEVKFRKVSRQRVTITQQNDVAQIQLCGEAATTANASATGLAYDARTYRPTINNVTDLTAIVQSLVLVKDAAGALHGTLDTGLMSVLSEPYPNSLQITRDIALVRISTDVVEGGIGSLALDWSFLVYPGFTTTEQRDEVVSCFVETVRTRSGGDKVFFYGVNGGSSKSLMLDAETVQVTFTENLYAEGETSFDNGNIPVEKSYVQRSVALKLKPVFSAIGFSQSVDDLSVEEESSFVETSPTLLRQQYASTPLSLVGTIDVESGNNFMHALFDLNW